jgi:hypothetical protein
LISCQDKKKVGNQLWAQRIYEHARQQSRVPADETFVTHGILKAKMEEFFGADLDDDLFESKQTKSKNTKESVQWTPLTCEPEVNLNKIVNPMPVSFCFIIAVVSWRAVKSKYRL